MSKLQTVVCIVGLEIEPIRGFFEFDQETINLCLLVL